jgi:hypothetical protein
MEPILWLSYLPSGQVERKKSVFPKTVIFLLISSCWNKIGETEIRKKKKIYVFGRSSSSS